MNKGTLVAVPSEAPGGLQAAPSAHFGHCAAYTVARVEDGQVTDVQIVANGGHEHGNCLAPVQTLAGMGVNALVAGGMGARPMQAMQEAGIQVYYAAGLPSVGDIVDAFASGKLVAFGRENLCTGHCKH